MATALDRDWAARFAARFGGRLHAATLMITTTGAVDASDPAGPPSRSTADYACSALAFKFEATTVPNERITKADYQVMVLRGTLATVAPSTRAALDLGGATADVDTILEARADGAAGNAVTAELVPDAPTAAGTLVEVGTNARVGYLAGASTVADIEALIATSLLVHVRTAGTAGNVLDAGDALSATALAGGADGAATLVANVIPRTGDAISIPPPGATAPASAIVVGVPAITEAFFTLHVRGPIG